MKTILLSLMAVAMMTSCPGPGKPDPLTGCYPYQKDCEPISDPPAPPGDL